MSANPEMRLTGEQRRAVEEFRKRHRTALLALLFTDIEGSTALKNEMGELPASALIERHGEVIRETLAEFSDAQEIFTAGDAFFLVFAKPSDAVRFALLTQVCMRELAAGQPAKFRVKIGIHLGEVVVAEDVEGGMVRDVLGMQVDLTSRVTSLAAGGQILMTRGVFDNARQILKGQLLPGIENLSWHSHGPYLLKGFDEPLAICEVGETSVAPLKQPTDSDTGKRAPVPGAEPVLGWRPAVEQEIPGTRWVLEKQLGEGGFGEVWLARHRRSKELRVFKFCFRADRLRALKREVTLFRLLKEVLGERPDIARLYDIQFEEAPYYLELEYTPGGDLAEWIETRGGFDNVPIEQRLEIVAQIATALSAAHSVGVIHRDVKPTNILVEDQKNSSVQVRLTDFGVGELVDRHALERIGITAAGFTETAVSIVTPSSYTGTRLYMAPELVAGRAPSIQSDIYSLGVVLYQMLTGDLSQPVTTDWERDIEDPLLCEDVHCCLAGKSEERLASAAELALRLRTLSERRAAEDERKAAERAQSRRRRLAVVFASAAAALVILGIALVYGLYQEHKAHQETLAEKERTEEARQREATARKNAERLFYYGNIGLAEKRLSEFRYHQAGELLQECPEIHRNWEWGRLQYLCNLDVMTLEHRGIVHSIAFSPNGKVLATVDSLFGKRGDYAAELWDVDTGEHLARLKGHKGAIYSVVFSHDGRFLATGGQDRTARIWDVKKNKVVHILEEHIAPVISVAFSPDGKRLATGEGTWNRQKTRSRCAARVWDVDTGRLLRTILAHDEGVASVAYSPDGRHLATGGKDATAKLWDLQTESPPVTFDGHGDCVGGVVFSPRGKYLATASWDHTAKVWDVETRRPLFSLETHSDFVRSVDFSPDGRMIATAGNDERVKIWDMETGRELRTLKVVGGAMCARFDPDGRYLAAGSWHGMARIWYIDGAAESRVLRAHTGAVKGLAFSLDGQWLATASHDDTARIWNVRTGQAVLELPGSHTGVESVAFNTDSTQLAVGCRNGVIKIWDLKSGAELRELEAFYTPATSLDFSPDGRFLAVSSGERNLSVTSRGNSIAIIWDTESGRIHRSLKGHRGRICSITFSPDGKTLATAAYDGTVKIWDAESGREMRSLTGDGKPITSAVFSSDGKRVAGAGSRGQASIWDTETGQPVITIAMENILYAIALSPDGKRLAAGGWDRVVRIWDTETGRETFALSGHESPVYAMAFSPDGRSLATAAIRDTSAIVWPAFPWQSGAYPGEANTTLTEERIESFKREYWKDHIAATKTGVSHARRFVDTSTYSPGVPVHVKLELQWDEDKSSVTVVENVPPGWTVQAGTQDGGFQTKIQGNKITWDVKPWTSPGVTLEYTATPPPKMNLVPVALTDSFFKVDAGLPLRFEDTWLRPLRVLAFQKGAYPDPDFAECQDSHIVKSRPNVNTGGCLQLEVGDWFGGTTDHKKVAIRFDLDAVPSTFTLGSAELRLYAFGEQSYGWRNRHTIHATRLLKSWDEGSAIDRDGQTASDGQVTFNSAGHAVQSWERPGILGVTDVADVESSTTAGENWPEWVTLDVTKSVRHFLDHPSENYGWKISEDPLRGVEDATIEYAAGTYTYKSAEAPEVHLRPMLLLVPLELASAHLPDGSDASSAWPRSAADAVPGSRDELRMLQREFEAVMGPAGKWEKLPDLAARIAGHPAVDNSLLNSMAWELADARRCHIEAAVALAKGAVKLSPADPHALDTLAWAETLSGEHADAVAHFEAAIKGLEDGGVSLAGLAIAQARLGHTDQAWDALARAIDAKADRLYLLEAYVEAAEVGSPRNAQIHEKIKRALGPIPPPQVETLPATPHAGEKVKVLYRPWRWDHTRVASMTMRWGVNRWQYPGDEAAKAKGAAPIFRHDSAKPICVLQKMSREGDAWTVTLFLPAETRQVDFRFIALMPSGRLLSRSRDFSILIAAPR